MAFAPRCLALLGLAAALAGCVMFERPPAPLACDPQLAGRWIPLPGSPQDKVPLGKDDHAEVDAACHVRLRDGGQARQPEFDALGFEIDGQRYLALGFDDLESLFGNDTPAPPPPAGMPSGAITLLKYRIREDTLEIAMPDVAGIMQRVERGTLKPREVDAGTWLFEGGPQQLRTLLADNPDLFDAFDGADRTLRMRRAAPGDLR